MKINFVKVCATFVAAAVLSMPAMAQDAKTLDELLQMIELGCFEPIRRAARNNAIDGRWVLKWKAQPGVDTFV